MTPRLGFIGLGNIGLPMAQRVAAAGLRPTVCDIVAARVGEAVAAGATAAATPAAVAAASDVIGICVRDDADVVEALQGKEGVLRTAVPGCIVAIHSTVRLATVLDLAAASATQGVRVIDAAVAGGAVGAAAGTLTVMVGGDGAAVAQARPLLDCFAKVVVHAGPLGSGCITKLCNQVMQYLSWQAALDAMQLAQAAGLSLEAMEEATRASGVLAESTRLFLGMHKRDPAVRNSPAFQAQLRSFVAIAEKDLRSALALAQEHGLQLPSTTMALTLMERMYGVDASSDKKERQ